jgi:HEAT repeat protein
MLNRLSQPDSIAARNAADVLGEFHYVSSIPALGAALSNPTYSGAARAEMAKALGMIGRSPGTQYLTAALGDSDPLVRSASLVALRSIPGFRDGSVAAPLVGDSDAGVRADAVVTIGMFKYAGGASVLVGALGDSSQTVRKKAAWALGEVGASAAIASAPLQNSAASDPSPLVRSLAKAALTKLK